MKARSDMQVAPNGARVEIGIVEFNGRTFSAAGAIIDEARGFVAGYVRDGESQCITPSLHRGGRYSLTTFDGQYLAILYLEATWRGRVGRNPFPATFFAWSMTLGGRRYHGRNAGPGMLCRMRAR